ncbi:DUF411 domain-containing protein [Pseudoalteromonas sp. T1lg48]|uniref:DUF411 domain-containing protein n=1 Tax=Pseudoalteromonas sp. T1lg48 TaxID=2077100 RepID=UPI000CF63395|nr:DUF411 domain-containing protein [Pseudoalteromonas sp. T1lg48]
MIKKFLKVAVFVLLLPSVVHANEHSNKHDVVELLVYKTPTCGCCKKWISHIESEGFITYAKDYLDISPVKAKLGIAANYRSCHSAISRDGFAFEGHVPAKFIRQFLKEDHADAIGLSVPAMPLGSPGMEVGDRFTPYQVLILYKDGSSKVYAEVKTYEEQF